MAIQSDGLTISKPSWISYFFRSGGFTAPVVIAVTLIGVVLAVLTTIVLTRASETPELIYSLIVADLAYLILLFGLIAWRIFALIGTRRTKSAGAALHLRLTGIFVIVDTLPTIIVAVFAAASLYFGFEAQFNDKVRSVVNNSALTAVAYQRERRDAIIGAVAGFAAEMNRAASQGIPFNALIQELRLQQTARGFPEAYLINGEREIVGRGEFSYKFTYDAPTEEQLSDARLGDLVVFEDLEKLVIARATF